MDLIKLYEIAIYFVVELEYNILINKLNPKLDKYLSSNNFTSWAIITAYNPQSKILSNSQNKLNNQKLLSDIANFNFLHTESTDEKGEWKKELGFIIFDIELCKAKLIGRKYNQKAICFGKLNEKARIIEL